MQYHLSSAGQNRGVFTLEELRRQRLSGELDGTEFLWREGMIGWQPIDVILNGPPPVPKKAGMPTAAKVAVIGAVCFVVVLVCVIGAVFVTNFWKGFNAARKKSAEARSERYSEELDAENDGETPLVFPTNSMTYADERLRSRAFRVRQYLEGYKERGNHNAQCDPNSEKLIEAWIANQFDPSPADKTKSVDLDELADEIVKSGCDDPLMLTVTSIHAVELHESIRRLEKALEGYDRSKHRGYPKFYASVTLAGKLTDQPGRIPPLDAAALNYLEQSFEDGSIGTEDQGEVAHILISGWGDSFYSRNAASVKKVVAAAGSEFRWLALVLEGESQINAAWKARGGGYADTVTADKWRQFNDKIGLARKALTEAWELQPKEPLAPARMVYVSMSDSDADEMYVWMNRTIAAQVDHAQAWNHMRWGLRPRWHGDLNAMLALGISAIDSGRFDTDVPRKFFDVVTDIEDEMDVERGEHIYGKPQIWPHFQRMYEGYIAAPSQSDWRAGWQTSYATVAYFAGKYDIARAQLEALNWKPNTGNLKGWGKDLSLMPLEVAARTGAQSKEVTQAESRYSKGDVKGALEIYSSMAKPSDDARTVDFIERRIATLTLESRLEAGEWVDFLPSEHEDVNFVYARGDFKTLADGALEVSSRNTGHMVYSTVPVGPNFEVRGQFEVANSSSKDFQAGLVFGLPDPGNTEWYSFRMKRNGVEGELVTLADGWTKSQVYQPLTLNSVTNTFSFRFENGKATASVNDRNMFMEVAPPRTNSIPDDRFLVGLGAFNDMNNTVLRYRNVQVRRVGTGLKRASK